MDKAFLNVFGHTAIDVILKVRKLPSGNGSVAVEEKKIRYGGTGANMAKAASDLDVPTRLISFVGDDFPEDYKQHLYGCGVDIRHLLELEGKRTPTCWIVTDKDEDQMAFIDQGAMEGAGDYDITDSILEDCRFIHVGTGDPTFYEKVIMKAKNNNIPIGFDPAQELKYLYTPEKFIRILKRCDIFFCNRSEFEIALEYASGTTSDDLLAHVKTVIKTMGKEGSVLYTRDDTIEIPSFKPSKIVDPTGSGDAYRAGFYGGLRRGFSLEDCCLAGSSRASFTLEFHGPQEGHITWEDVVRRMEDNKGN